MPFGVLFFLNGVTAVRIDHQIERLIEFDEFVDKLFGILIVNVVVACPVNDQ
jgi:hypothetical protein